MVLGAGGAPTLDIGAIACFCDTTGPNTIVAAMLAVAVTGGLILRRWRDMPLAALVALGVAEIQVALFGPFVGFPQTFDEVRNYGWETLLTLFVVALVAAGLAHGLRRTASGLFLKMRT